MSKVVPLHSKHPLVGTWRPGGDDGSAEFVISAAASGGFAVTGTDRSDGEHFEISDLTWDGSVLRFTSRMPSTNWVLEHEFRALDGNQVDHRYTHQEFWSRAPS